MEAPSVITVRLHRKAGGSITAQAFGDLDAFQCRDVSIELDADGRVLAVRDMSGRVTADAIREILDRIAVEMAAEREAAL